MKQPLIQIFVNSGEEVTIKYISSQTEEMTIDAQSISVHPDDLQQLKSMLEVFMLGEGFDCE